VFGLTFIRRLLLLALLSLGWQSVVRADLTAYDEMMITVTPVADVSLTLDTTYYSFGNVSVNTSTSSITPLQLSNNGEISVTVDKRIHTQSDPAGWTASTSTGFDAYVLYVATATVQPSLSSFGVATRLGAQGNVTALTGTSGSSFTMLPEGASSTANLWFRLDMPTSVSSLTPRRITIRFTGSAP